MPPRKPHPPSTKRAAAPRTSTYDTVVRLAREFPGVEESTSYGTPALKVRGTLLARLREDNDTLVLKTSFVDRDLLLRADPKTYFLTDHYRNYQCVLVRLSRIRPAELRDRLEEAWRRVASKSMLATFNRQP